MIVYSVLINFFSLIIPVFFAHSESKVLMLFPFIIYRHDICQRESFTMDVNYISSTDQNFSRPHLEAHVFTVSTYVLWRKKFLTVVKMSDIQHAFSCLLVGTIYLSSLSVTYNVYLYTQYKFQSICLFLFVSFPRVNIFSFLGSRL